MRRGERIVRDMAAGKYTVLDDQLYDYVVSHMGPRDEVLRRVEDETHALGSESVMLSAPEQGRLLTMLAALAGARRALEIGTFTGYGAICIARGLADGGRLLCCEKSERWAAVAQKNIDAAGVSDVVDIRLGPALETLDALDPAERFDFAYIDADKTGYPDYYERVVERLDPGGLVVLDNTLLSGRVLEPADDDDSARAIAAINDRIAADDRVDAVMLAIADGVTLARRR
jgi:caffeoyl-CoA O-methyltransferase